MSENRFDQEQRDLLQHVLDYNLGLDDAEQRRVMELLLQQDVEAGQLHAKVQAALAPLKEWPDDEAPGDLSGRTLDLIRQHKQAQVMARASDAIAGGGSAAKPIGVEPAGFWGI